MNFSLGQAIGVGGPVGIVITLLVFLAKSYFEKKKDDREETKSERESESGIVETTGAAIKIVREQMIALGTDLSTLRNENAILRLEIRKLEQAKEAEIKNLQNRVTALEKENARLSAL